VTQRTVSIGLSADISAYERSFTKAEKIAGDFEDQLQSLDGVAPDVQVGADVSRALSALDDVDSAARSLPDVEMPVDADVAPALDGLDDVETAARRLVSADFAARVDADIEQAEKQLTGLRSDLDLLSSLDPEVDVTVVADTARAQDRLDRAEARLNALRGARATMEVRADTDQAERAVDGLADDAQSSLSDAGSEAGEGFGTSVLAALATIPVAGAFVGIGAAAAQALTAGFDSEVRRDLLQSRTGLDEATAGKIARAAGEAYANVFGESVSDNIGTAEQAIAAGLLDPQATQQNAQAVIEQLTGVADILDEDVSAAAVAAGTLLRTGLADNADAAFDVLVKGQQAGANSSKDLLDTLTEYPALFQRLGLDGATATGLIAQGLEAGARNTDLVADALKEFQIRATDGSTLSAEGFERLGLSAEEMTARIAAGGESAREGLDVVLDRLRATEDPVERNAAAVALFGTQAEDLGEALFALDASNAVDQLGQVEGAAKGAVDQLGSNSASALEGAKRNIEVAALGIGEALAAAFAPELGGVAEYVAGNREELVGMLLDGADAALTLGGALVDAAAAGSDGFAQVTGAVADVLRTAQIAVAALELIPGVDLGGASEELGRAADNLETMSENATVGAELLRTGVGGALDQAQEKLNEVGLTAKTQAAFHDATVALAGDMAAVGTAADGSRLQVDLANGSLDTTSEAGGRLHGQLTAVAEGFEAQLGAAARAGEGTESLTATFDANRASLVQTIEQLGVSRSEAEALADQYLEVPDEVRTKVDQPGMTKAQADATELRKRTEAVPDIKRTQVSQPGITKAQADAEDLRRRTEAVPNQRSTTISQPGMPTSLAQTTDLRSRLGMLPGSKSTAVSAPGASQAAEQARAVRDAVNAIPTSRTTTITTVRETVNRTVQGSSVRSTEFAAAGALFVPVQHFAGGGIPGDIADRHLPELAEASGPMRVWKEQETQGELYAPLANDWRRPRAKALVAEVVDRFGGTVEWHAAGGLRPGERSLAMPLPATAPAPTGARQGTSVTVQVDARGAHDPEAVARRSAARVHDTVQMLRLDAVGR
jgi:hypothetical protein